MFGLKNESKLIREFMARALCGEPKNVYLRTIIKFVQITLNILKVKLEDFFFEKKPIPAKKFRQVACSLFLKRLGGVLMFMFGAYLLLRRI